MLFLHHLKKNLGRVLGVFWACSGCVCFDSILKKKLGRVPGVFSVFQCVQCVVSSDPKNETHPITTNKTDYRILSVTISKKRRKFTMMFVRFFP